MADQNIELSKFFERDIIEFLDQKKAERSGIDASKEKFYGDYESALKKGDFQKGAEIFEEALTQYNSLNRDNPYKSIMYEDILEMIELSKKGLINMDEENNLTKLLKLLSEQEIESHMPDIIQAIEKIKVERAQVRIAQESKLYEEKAKIDKIIKELSQELFILLRKKDLKKAIDKYKNLKETFEKYPPKFDNEKQEVYEDILAFYMQIKRLKEELTQKSKIEKSLEIKKEHLTPIKKEQPSDLEKIKVIVAEIKEDAQKRDFHSAKSKIILLREIASHVPDDHIRNMLEQKINTMNQKLEFVKRTSEHQT